MWIEPVRIELESKQKPRSNLIHLFMPIKFIFFFFNLKFRIQISLDENGNAQKWNMKKSTNEIDIDNCMENWGKVTEEI